MFITRYIEPGAPAATVGTTDGTSVESLGVRSIGQLLTSPREAIRKRVAGVRGVPRPLKDVILLPPVDGRMEVWAAGVTYQRSRAARVEESAVRDIYDRVYDDPRPELFFKSVPWRVVTDGEAIAVRGDSQLNVPEAELAVMVNAYAEIVGYLVCNDVSSRSIEGQNPLYLPQAKLYAGSCALGTMVRPAWELGAGALAISVSVSRMGSEVWSGTASTGEMHRPLEELVSWLFREEQYPDGVILSTGTGVVPGLDFTLKAGDCVTVNIESVGSLMNNVVEGKGSFTWLASAGRGRTGGV